MLFESKLIICSKCNSPSWNNPVTGHSDCSNSNCK